MPVGNIPVKRSVSAPAGILLFPGTMEAAILYLYGLGQRILFRFRTGLNVCCGFELLKVLPDRGVIFYK